MKIKIFSYSFFATILASVFFILGCSICFAEVAAIAPEHNVEIESPNNVSTHSHWKELWDQARELARTQNLWQAKTKYQQLFKIRPNITEAQWEYCKLLILSGEMNEASKVVDHLLDLEPDNAEYLIAAGNIAIKTGQASKATKYFGYVYEADPVGKYGIEALDGLIDAYSLLGKDSSHFLVAEQYYQRTAEPALLVTLARLSKKLQKERSSRYYYSLLVEQYPDVSEYIYEAARVHDTSETQEKAAEYWRLYLNERPSFLPFHHKLSEYYLANKQVEKALPHLIYIYKQENLDPDMALRIGRLYNDNLKRPDKALLYFEQYSLSGSRKQQLIEKEINEIRSYLASQYLPIVENNAAEQLWHDLDRITIAKNTLFMMMVLQLRDQGKTQYEYDLLTILYDQTADPEITYDLALAAEQLGKTEITYDLLKELDQTDFAKKEYLLKKANIEIDYGFEQQALISLKGYLKSFQNDRRAVMMALELAGLLGLFQEIEKLWEHVNNANFDPSEFYLIKLEYLSSLDKCGLYSITEPEYYSFREEVKNNRKWWARVSFHLAESLLEQDLFFEAEKIIRQVLAQDLEINTSIRKLIEISLEEKQVEKARSWLSLLQDRINENDASAITSLALIEAQILIAENEYDDAVDLVDSQLFEIEKSQQSSDTLITELLIHKLKAYYFNGDFSACREMIDSLSPEYRSSQPIDALNSLLTDVGFQKRITHLKEAIEKKKISFLQLRERSVAYQEFGAYLYAKETIELALQIIPESLTAIRNRLEYLNQLALYQEAIAAIDSISLKHPDQEYYNRLRLKLEFKSGNFEKVIEKVTDIEAVIQDNQKEDTTTGEDVYFWKKLLLARALWAQNKREEAIQVYDSLLTSPVDTMFLEKVEVAEINFNLPPLKKSFWNIITFTNPPEPDPITTVMEPRFVANNRGQPVDDIAASMYGKYRWQKLIRKELLARQATESRDFYTAEKQYLSLLKEEKSEETIFDLADVYNRLGLYGKAAELYEIMKKNGPLYPGLDEYINANVLKRQPRISTTLSTINKKGRDAYIDLKKDSYGIEGWFSPTYDQEMSLSFFHNTFGSHYEDTTSTSNRIVATYSTYFEDTLDLNMSFGTERPDGGRTNEVLYKFELIGRLSDAVEGYGRFEQDLVEDNISSVINSIIYRDIETGMKYDLFPRLFVGADLRLRLYSDENQQKRYKLWSMYHLFGETNQFKVKYSYENIRNSNENVPRESISENRVTAYDRIYWSPDLYWQHLFTLHFMHYFDNNRGPNSPLSYFSVDYSVGFETDSNVNHEFDLNILLEINKHFLLKGNLKNLSGDDIDSTEAGVSLIYRW